MTFDLVILDNKGKPSAQVPISPHQHFLLMNIVKEQNLSLLKRLSDYYANTDFAFEELEPLERELEEVKILVTKENIKNLLFISEALRLIRLAKTKKVGLTGIAD